MVKILELREIIRFVNKSTIQEFYLINGEVRISLKKPTVVVQGQKENKVHRDIIQSSHKEAAVTLESEYPQSKSVAPVLIQEEKKPELHRIVSTVIGVFSSFTDSSTEPLVKKGNRITAGTLLGNCRVDSLKLEHEIISEINGEIIDVLVEDGEIVEYGQPLYLVKAE